jgi:hypothetical protein
MVVLEQQKLGTESELLKQALKQTFAGLVQANQTQRRARAAFKTVHWLGVRRL